MKCEHCLHWGRDGQTAGDYRDCQAVPHDPVGGRMAAGEQLAVVVDCEQYHAALCTRADFGCVLFAPKKEN